MWTQKSITNEQKCSKSLSDKNFCSHWPCYISACFRLKVHLNISSRFSVLLFSISKAFMSNKVYLILSDIFVTPQLQNADAVLSPRAAWTLSLNVITWESWDVGFSHWYNRCIYYRSLKSLNLGNLDLVDWMVAPTVIYQFFFLFPRSGSSAEVRGWFCWNLPFYHKGALLSFTRCIE